MKNTKLIELLSSFSKNELKQCLLWLKSPIHNESKVLVSLFEEISLYYPDFAEEEIESKKLFHNIYPEKDYSDDLMRKNCSNLYEQCLEYITWQHFSQQTIENKKSLFGALLQKHQYKDLLFEINAVEKEMQKGKMSFENIRFTDDISHFKSKAIFNLSEKKGKQGSEEKYSLYTNSINSKVDAFFVDFVSDYLVYLSFSKVYNFKIDHLKTEFIDSLFLQTNQESSFINIYYHLYLLQSNYTTDNLNAIFELLEKNYQAIAPKDLHTILTILINSINDNFNLDSIEVEKQRLRVYKIMTEPSVLLANSPVLNAILYSNIIYTYVNLKEFERAKNFIDKYTDFLDPQMQLSYKTLALARLHFAQDEYDQAQTYLITAEKLEPHLRLRARLILLQIYFLKSEFDVLVSYIESTTKLLQREKSMFPASTRKSIFLFLIYLKKLALIKILPSKKTISNLKTQLQTTENIFVKKWLIDELDKIS